MFASVARRGRALLPLFAGLLVAAAPPPPLPAGPSPLAVAMHSHVAFLADDLLEGRGLGTRGHEIAARYVADQFAGLGLQPAGTDGWFQRIPFDELRFASDSETLSFERGGKTIVWTNGVEATVNAGTTPGPETITAPLVFVGYGLRDARLGIDDYAGLDVRGKIVVVLSGAPPGMDSEIGAHLGRNRGGTALAQGAVGVLSIRPPAQVARAPWAKIAASARRQRRAWVGPDGRTASDSARLPVAAAVNEAAATVLFDGAPMSSAEVQAAAARGPVKGFPLAGQITVRRANAVTRVSSPNVLALLPGSDPRLVDQIVLVMAHLDHLGIVPGKAGDNLYNGAMDNASGVATLIETARALAASRGGKGPRRSVLFLVTTGEESGLLGSDYFARFPTVSLDRVAAVVNIDMPILTCNFSDIVAFGADHSTMSAAVRAAAAAEGLGLSPDPQPEEAIFTRSDHYPLVRAGVPSVFLKTGWHDMQGGLACRDAERDFRLNRYHEASDDMNQAFDWEAGAKFVRVNTGIVRRLADAAEEPRWYEGDYFGETFAPSGPRAKR